MLIIGKLSIQQRETLTLALRDLPNRVTFVESATSARRLLDRGPTPGLVAVQISDPEVGFMVAWIRGHAHLCSLPIVGLVEEVSDSSYRQAYEIGVDDVVPIRAGRELAIRARRLCAEPPAVLPSTGRIAAVVHQDERRRRVMGRVVRQAGFEPVFATDAVELTRDPGAATAAVVLLEEQRRAEDTISMIASLREYTDDDNVPMEVVTRQLQPEKVTALSVVERVSAAEEDAPADGLLFLVNELLRPAAAENRNSARLLFETVCRFRLAGDEFAEAGLVYNISSDGLYIRTLNVPRSGARVWLELTPPGHPPLHLRADVRWGRQPGKPGTVPCGFGVQLALDDCPPKDLAEYRAFYATLLRSATHRMGTLLRRPPSKNDQAIEQRSAA